MCGVSGPATRGERYMDVAEGMEDREEKHFDRHFSGHEMSSSCSLRVLCSYLDGSPSVVLSSESQRIIFDAGEGVQRLCVEHRMRLAKLEGVLLTSLSPETVAGLPGLYLTCADSGRKSLSVVGPSGTKSFWQSTGSFTHRTLLSVTLSELSDYHCMDFGSFYIHSIPLTSIAPTNHTSHMCYVVETKVLPGKFDVAKAKSLGVPVGPVFGALQRGSEVTLSDGRTIRPQDVLGPSDPARYAAVIGNIVIAGLASVSAEETVLERLVGHPFWRRFQSGGECEGQMDCVFHFSPQTVTQSECYLSWMRSLQTPCSDGRGRPTQHILLGKDDCLPQSAFIASALYSCKLHRLFPDVFSYVSAFSSDDDQCVSSVVNGASGLEAVSIHRGYPGMKINLLPARVAGFDASSEIMKGQKVSQWIDRSVDEMWTGVAGVVEELVQRVRTEAKLAIDQCEHRGIEEVDTEEAGAHSMTIDESVNRALLYQCATNAISFLGTGCAQPSKYRNVSGIFIQMDGGAMLLDCGEGTWQQLIRMARHTPSMMTADATSTSPPDDNSVCLWAATALKAIWISHPHADHHLGLVRVITERRKSLFAHSSTAPENDPVPFTPLLVIAPPSVLAFLKEFSSVDQCMAGAYLPVPNSHFENSLCRPCGPEQSLREESSVRGVDPMLREGANNKQTDLNSSATYRPNKRAKLSEFDFVDPSSIPVINDIVTSLGIATLENVLVDHCWQSYAVSVVSTMGWKLVYSGDTRPCQQLVTIGKNATILIHEATFDDTKPDEAVKKKHSTISEAVTVSEEMGAYRLILTHFSQRYPSVPPLPAGCRDIVLAFDFMRLTFADCLWAHKMNEVLAIVFPSDEEEFPEDDVYEDEPSASEARQLKSKKQIKNQGRLQK